MSSRKASKKKLPTVAIVGRPNVGKSTLFNRIIGKQRAIVHNEEGITRDRFICETEWDGRRFLLVDTGGIVEQPLDDITHKIQEQVRCAIEASGVVVFVVDGQEEITRSDRTVCEALLKNGRPVVLAVNKLDNAQLQMHRYEFFELGLGEPFAVSSSHNLGIEELMRAVTAYLPAHTEALPEQETPETVTERVSGDQPVKIAVIGRPNVGKSSFINALLNAERAIVSEIPGTTRDAIDVEFRWRDKDYVLIDTAGMRRKAGIRDAVEHFSVARALRTVRRADVCLIMVEATEGLTEQDKRIIGYAIEQGTAFILVWTKWDLVSNKEQRFKALAANIDLKMPHIKFAPQITVSNVTRTRIFTVFDYVDRVALEAQKRISTSELNQLIDQVKRKHNPPSQKGRHAKILYATQPSIKPTQFVLFVNQKRLFHFSYLRFIENQIREAYGFEGVPIHIELREETRTT